MFDTFYKASRAMLARTDLTPAEKLVRIVRAHFRAFEKRVATVRELAAATGLSERGVRKILSRLWTARFRQLAEQSAEQSAERSSERSSGKAEQGSAPSCSKSLSVVRDVDKGERSTPAPLAAQGGKANDWRRTSFGKQLAARAARKADLLEWEAYGLEAVRSFGLEAVEAYLVARKYLTCWPRDLAADVRAFLAESKAAAFRERLRTIRAEGLVRATGPDGPGRVVYVEPDRPLLVIERRVPPPAGTSYGPQTKRWEVTTPEALAAWTFRPEQPVLGFMDAPEVAANARGKKT